MKLRVVIIGLVLAIVLAFSSGAFAHFVFPGRSETVPHLKDVQIAWVNPCDRFWQLIAEARTDMGERFIQTHYPARFCLK